MVSRRKVLKAVTVLVAVIAVLTALYIMANRLGLVEGLDFGAGAYYYTDIPDYEKVVRDDVYTARLPYWVYVVLFLAWGWLMYRLWVFLDRDRKDKKKDS